MGCPPHSEGQRFFLYKAFKLDKNPRTFTTQVFQPRQAIHSNFWPKRNPFGNFIPMDEKRIVHFLRTSLRSFPRRCLNGEFLTKEELLSCPGSRDSHLCLGFPLANGL